MFINCRLHYSAIVVEALTWQAQDLTSNSSCIGVLKNSHSYSAGNNMETFV